MKTFKKTYKFICDECGEFAYTEMEYCERCGKKTLRKATKEDYANYENKTIRTAKEDRIVFDKAQKAEKVEIKAEKATEKAKKAVEKAEKAAEKAKKAAE